MLFSVIHRHLDSPADHCHSRKRADKRAVVVWAWTKQNPTTLIYSYSVSILKPNFRHSISELLTGFPNHILLIIQNNNVQAPKAFAHLSATALFLRHIMTPTLLVLCKMHLWSTTKCHADTRCLKLVNANRSFSIREAMLSDISLSNEMFLPK